MEDRQRSLARFLNFGRLGKLMSKTLSEYDEEALVAMRQANAMIRGAGHSWPEIMLRVLTNTLKEEEKKPEEEMDPLAVLEQTLRWLRDGEKITEEEHTQLLQMVRAMFRSKDTNLKRRVSQRVRDIMRKMKVSRVEVGTGAKPPFSVDL